ncbi:unnamed protein product [Danaus chrysippus]|uniref:(African queen) hypothetical protein n=1 Tax=Danaus chrysippus TaxID=151541 RepID=A0A8J2QC97_9NEOP|nr:unnamed protein product [Danaus chrysippus]
MKIILNQGSIAAECDGDCQNNNRGGWGGEEERRLGQYGTVDETNGAFVGKCTHRVEKQNGLERNIIIDYTHI